MSEEVSEATSESAAAPASEASTEAAATTESTEAQASESVGIEGSLKAAASAKDSESKDSGETTANEDGEVGSDSEGQLDGPPEEYADFHAPDGPTLGDEGNKFFAEKMKEYGASQDNAQALYDIIGEVNSKFLEPGLVEQQKAAFAERAIEWEKIAKADPRLGGENGELWPASIAKGNNAIDMLAEWIGKGLGDTGNVKDTFLNNGWLSHPDTLLALHAIGERMGPDKLDPPGDGGGSGKDWDEMSLQEKLGYGKDALSKQGREIMRTSGIDVEDN